MSDKADSFMFGRPITMVIAVAMVLVTACAGSFDNDDGLTVFRYNESGNITSLDPIYTRNQANIWAVSQVFNGLVEFDSVLHIRPAIAKRWAISEDGCQYTFTLRDDVFFHDDDCFAGGLGRKVVASDFVFSLNRLVNPALNAPGAWVMNQVERDGQGALWAEAPDDTTFVIRLIHPFPPFVGLLAMSYCSVVPSEAVTAYGSDFRRRPVGTGPFRFAYWKEGVRLVLRKNPAYFEFENNVRLPYLDAVSISFIIDRQTAFLEFVKGKLDFLSAVDASYKDELLTPAGELNEAYADRFIKLSKPFLNTEYLGIRMTEEPGSVSAPLADVQIRQAINFGLDRAKLLRYLRNNMGTPALSGFVPVGMPGFDINSGGYNYNPDKAADLLRRAGYPGGEGLPPIALHTNQDYQDIAQFIQHELAKLGMRITINVMPPATIRELMAKGESPFFRASWIADYPDAENYLALFYSGNKAPTGPNYTHFANEQYDRLYKRALSITNDSLRFEVYREMNQLIIEQAPVIFLFYDQSVRFFPKYVRNLTNNPLNHLDLRRVYIQKP